MKKTLAILLAVFLAVGALAGCGKTENRDDRLSLVTSIYPLYDWANAVVGEKTDRVDVQLLVDGGVEAHSFQPSVKDIARIADCDMLLYVGGESEKWINEAIGESKKGIATVKLMDVLADRLYKEEIVEGMQGEADGAFDEHIWLSLQNAIRSVQLLASVVAVNDPDCADIYKANAAAYCEKLTALDQAYRDTVAASPRKTVLFADRFPFRYLTEDYGLTYYAAFAGCSAEASADFKTVVSLSDTLKRENLPAVLILENGNRELADTVIAGSGVPGVAVLVMDSMQAVSGGQTDAGKTYLNTVKNNLTVLKQALA